MLSTSALTLALACNGKGEKNQNFDNGSNITGRHDCTDGLKCAFISYRPSASWPVLITRREVPRGDFLSSAFPSQGFESAKRAFRWSGSQCVWLRRGGMVILNISKIKIECYVHYMKEKLPLSIFNNQLRSQALHVTCQRIEEEHIE